MSQPAPKIAKMFGPSQRGQALVAILRDLSDFDLLRSELWYRVPKDKAPRRWPPQWLAFYQTKIFGPDAWAVHWYGRVRMIREVTRRDLFPNEPEGPKSDRVYYQIHLESLERLEHPIVSRRLRRLVFVPTTYHKLTTAEEINDLFDDSPLEDALWAELKRLDIAAERQWDIRHEGRFYFLDFAVYCESGKLDIETDGDLWHAEKEQIPEDNRRNNAIESLGWHVLRFNGQQVREEMAQYCVPKITDAINRLGGLSGEGRVTYHAAPDGGITRQLALFDNKAPYPDENQAGRE